MTTIPIQGAFTFGPYMGYHGRAEYDQDSGLWHGEIVGLRDVVTFQGKAIEELAGAFLKSVEDYYNFCKSRGEEPERPYSGKFVVRIKPEVHQKISIIASSTGVSLNQFVADQLEAVAEKDYVVVGSPSASYIAKKSEVKTVYGTDARTETDIRTGVRVGKVATGRTGRRDVARSHSGKPVRERKR